MGFLKLQEKKQENDPDPESPVWFHTKEIVIHGADRAAPV
jgi:hypothetical protein